MFDFKVNVFNVYGQYCVLINFSLYIENNVKGILNCFILKIKGKKLISFFFRIFFLEVVLIKVEGYYENSCLLLML